MTLYRATLVDSDYQPIAVICRKSDKSIQDFSDDIHSEVDNSHLSSLVSGIAVEVSQSVDIPDFLREQAS